MPEERLARRVRARPLLLVAVVATAAALAVSWARMASPQHFVANLAGAYLLAWAVFFLVAPGTVRSNLPRAILFNLSLGVAVAALEALALTGLVDYRVWLKTPILAPWRNPAFREDPELIYRHRAHARIRGRMRGGDFTFVFDAPGAEMHEFDLRYDENGFRNASDLKTADYALVGDSFVEGNYASDDEVVSARVAALTGKTVANLGLIGYGPRQELVVLRRYALPLRPRAVAWVFFEGNDLDNVYVYDEMIDDLDAARASHHSFLERSFTKNALMALSRLAGDPKPSGLARSARVPIVGGGRRRIFFLYPGEELNERQRDALAATRTILGEAWRSCREQDVELVLAFAPTKYRVCRDVADFDEGAAAASWVLNDLPQRLRTIAREISPDFAFVDLTPPLARAAREGRLPYHADDSHWNATGHDLAARAISAALAGE